MIQLLDENDKKVIETEISEIKENIDDCISMSLNLYNGIYKDGYYINQTNGEETQYENWCCSDFIKIKPKKEYYCFSINSSNVYSKSGNIYYAFYDTNKKYITGNIFYNNVDTILTNNENAKYIKISGYKSTFESFFVFGEKDKITFLEGKSKSDFLPFGNEIINEKKGFEKKILMTYGDSITAQGKWQPYVVNNCGFYKHIKHGFPGDRLMRLACSDYIANLTEDFDILLIMAGTNDFGQDRIIGNPDDINADGKDNSFSGSFYGGLNLLIQNIIKKFPEKRIVFITPVIGKRKNGESFFNKKGSENGIKNSNGNTIRDFSDAIINRCKYFGIPYIDLTSGCGWNEYNIQYFCQDEDDNFIHPSENGAQRMASYISSQLKSML